MASRTLFARVSRPLRGVSPATPIARSARSFQSSSRLLQTTTMEAPVKKPVGAFRGGLFGFLLGSTLSGAGVYYYILEEYKVSNELLTEDIYALQAAVQKIHTYVQTLEDKVEKMERRK